MRSVRSSVAVPGVARSARRSARPVRHAAPAWGELSSAAITEAKRQWLTACVDGSPSARVERLYEAYRDLVIGQAAMAVQGWTANAS